MERKKLYIIGNGFDLHHGIKSGYWHFKEYLEDKNSRLVENLEEYFGPEALWSDFEETLAKLDTKQIVDECSNYLQPYGAADWSDAYHHDYQYEVQQRIDLITKSLKQNFTEWILQLKIPDTATEDMVVINKDATFINFNYTDTLEQLYNVDPDRILYIHNKAINIDSNLILGHSRKPKNSKEVSYDENTDVRIIEGDRILDDYFTKTYKSTDTILADNTKFFNSLKDVDIIYVLGHSLAQVDRPYFRKITNLINISSVKWKVSFHNKKDITHFDEFFTSLGVNQDHIKYGKMTNFDTKQLKLFEN